METRLPFDLRAPAAARMVVDGALAQHVSAATLDDAKLAMSELVTNSLQHSGAAVHGTLLIGVGRHRGGFWLAVEDAGQDGFVGPRSPDRQAGGGFGLHLVEDLSECWGTVRAARRGTRVWAQFSTAATHGEP